MDKAARLRIKQLATYPERKRKPHYQYTDGTKLTKNWKGRRIVVQIEGKSRFRYEGRVYASLSAIASELAGSPQSGPRFFGIAKRKSKGAA